MHVDLIGPYIESIRQQQPGGTTIFNNSSLTCMMIIDPATGCLDIVKIPTFDLNEITIGNDEYTDKSYAMVSQMFNNTWICRYPHPCKVVFENAYEFKRDFTPFLKGFDLKPILTSVKYPQGDSLVELVHQVILNMLVTKDLGNKFFNYIYPWGETLAYISWAIRASYNCNLMVTPGQSVFCRDMLFDLALVVDWKVATATKQRQVDFANVRENYRQFTHDYVIGDRVYVEMTGIYHKPDYKKQGPYRITELIRNGTVRVQRVQVNKRINIRQLKPHFNE